MPDETNSNPGDDLAPDNPEIFVTPLIRLDGIMDEMNGHIINPIFLPPGNNGLVNQWEDIANNGIQLIGDGSELTPYRIDFDGSDLPLTAVYDSSKNLVIDDSTVMPAIKAGTNVTIDADGTLNAAGGATAAVLHTHQVFDDSVDSLPILLVAEGTGLTDLAIVDVELGSATLINSASFNMTNLKDGGEIRIYRPTFQSVYGNLEFTDVYGAIHGIGSAAEFMVLKRVGINLFVVGLDGSSIPA